MTLLSVIQRAATLVGGVIPPTAVATTASPLARQMIEFAKIDAEDLADRIDWSALKTEGTFTTVAAVSQPNALPFDFGRFAFREGDRGELYDVARREGIAGPANDQQWRSVVDGFNGWSTTWRLFGGGLQLAPAPPSGLVYTFDYISTNLYADQTGLPKDTLDADTDTFRIPERCIALGVVWRWKAAKGFDYAEDLANAETQIAKEAGKSNGPRRVLLVGRPRLHGDRPFDGILGGGADNGQYIQNVSEPA